MIEASRRSGVIALPLTLDSSQMICLPLLPEDANKQEAIDGELLFGLAQFRFGFISGGVKIQDGLGLAGLTAAMHREAQEEFGLNSFPEAHQQQRAIGPFAVGVIDQMRKGDLISFYVWLFVWRLTPQELSSLQKLPVPAHLEPITRIPEMISQPNFLRPVARAAVLTWQKVFSGSTVLATAPISVSSVITVSQTSLGK